MKLYNTLTKNIDALVPSRENAISLYSCGPTVYNHIHIGNLASFIYADTLRRVLTAAGYDVHHVMNFTDVDDKTIKESTTQYPKLPPKEALKKLTTKYEKTFIADMRQIGNDVDAIDFIRATDSITQMQELIKKLHQEGFAYIANDGVYFSIKNYRESGKTYGQLSNLDTNQSQQRVDNDEYDKNQAHDFALWKKQKNNEPAWDFTLDSQSIKGRPGWHIECSAMSKSKLGIPFDIHTGGIDLIFPHHENEIAQSAAAEELPILAKMFFHNEHLLVDGKKMSKSLHNFYTLEDITKKCFDPLAFRLLVLQSHYRKPINFSWEALAQQQDLLNSLRAWADLQFQSQYFDDTGPDDEHILDIGKEIAVSLGNDLMIQTCIAKIMKLSSETESKSFSFKSFTGVIKSIDQLFGLNLTNQENITTEQKKLLTKRYEARKNNDWKTSDEIRETLINQSIQVKDTPKGQVWFRIRQINR